MKLILFCALLVASVDGFYRRGHLDYINNNARCDSCMSFIDSVKALPGIEKMSKKELQSHAKDWCSLLPPMLEEICMAHLPKYLGKIYDMIHGKPASKVDSRKVCAKLGICKSKVDMHPFYNQEDDYYDAPNYYYPIRQRGYRRGRYY